MPWIEAYNSDAVLGEQWDWMADARVVRRVAPEAIQEDLDLIASIGDFARSPTVDEQGLIEAPDVNPTEAAGATERILSEVTARCDT